MRLRILGLVTCVVGTLMALCLAVAPSARAQDSATFATLGPVGLGLTHGQSGYALHGALGHRFGRSVVSGRAVAILVGNDFLWDEIWDLALLYGRVAQRDDGAFSFGLGPAYVGGSVLDDERTLGLALEAQVFVRTSGWLSVGVYGFGNLNGKSSFGGATLALRFGRF
jgi:hypothetical protein